MDLNNKIQSAEKQFRIPVEQFFKSIYREDNLISHGIEHHRRVWNYAKELLNYSTEVDNVDDPLFVSKHLIACYLHDIGMAIDPGNRHGRHSRELCEQFLKKYNLKVSDFTDVLQAIENHDNKEYSESPGNDKLLTLLSTADDLDAFGYIGIYRYAEIYLKRGIPYEKIGHQILENSAKRFQNFASGFRNSPNLVEKHEKRYLVLDDFYKHYNKYVTFYQFNTLYPTGFCGVIEIISDTLNNQASLESLISGHIFSKDKIINDFFKSLLKE